jgi:hypothetical protein
MKQLKISLQKYVEYHSPAPDYILLKRFPIKHNTVNGVAIPDHIIDSQGYFVGVGEVLKINDYASENDWVNERKKHLKGCKYVGFNFHVAENISIAPQIEIEGAPKLVTLHVKNVIMEIPNLEDLINAWIKLNEEEDKKAEEASAFIQQERSKISKGA